MNIQKKIEELRLELAALEGQQKKCVHNWDRPFYNAEKYKREELTGEYEERGSDRWPITRFVDAYKDRWTRRCLVCGLEQHTYEQKTVEVKKEPKF